MADELSQAPFATYREYCSRGILAYQRHPVTGELVFYPRLFAPGDGTAGLIWHESTGRGEVYATTTQHWRDGARTNLALIDLDEGFRLMSCVVGLDPDDVKIGMRVRIHFDRVGEQDGGPFPFFMRDEEHVDESKA